MRGRGGEGTFSYRGAGCLDSASLYMTRCPRNTKTVVSGCRAGRAMARRSAFEAFTPVKPTSAGPPSTNGLCGVSRTGRDSYADKNGGGVVSRAFSARRPKRDGENKSIPSNREDGSSDTSLHCRICRVRRSWCLSAAAWSPSLSVIRLPRVLGGVSTSGGRRHARFFALCVYSSKDSASVAASLHK